MVETNRIPEGMTQITCHIIDAELYENFNEIDPDDIDTEEEARFEHGLRLQLQDVDTRVIFTREMNAKEYSDIVGSKRVYSTAELIRIAEWHLNTLGEPQHPSPIYLNTQGDLNIRHQ